MSKISYIWLKLKVSQGHAPPGDAGGTVPPHLPQPLGAQAPLGLWTQTSIPASIFMLSPLCLAQRPPACLLAGHMSLEAEPSCMTYGGLLPTPKFKLGVFSSRRLSESHLHENRQCQHPTYATSDKP